MKNRLYFLVLISLFCCGIGLGCSGVRVDAKSIYFAGEYSGNCGIILNQYSSPEGKNVGNYQINIPHAYNAFHGELIKIGKNKYRSKKKGLVFTVHKKKIKVKVTNFKRYDRGIKGTYKLWERYPRP